MVLESSQVGQINKHIVINLNSKMAALFDIDGQIGLLLGQLLHKSCSISQSFPYIHSDFPHRLFTTVEIPAVEYKFLILEKHCYFQKLNWISQLFQKFLQ
jgi:hypothetical protein